MSKIAKLPFFEDQFLYQEYEKKVEERIRKLVDEDAWDDWAMTLYRHGDISCERVYELAAYEASEQIYEEVVDAYI